MVTTVYELGVPSGGTAFIGAANREDLLDVVTVISPTDTPMFTMCPKTKISNVQTEWITDKLDQAGSNAVDEGSDPTFNTAQLRARLLNYAQISREAYNVSDTQRAVNPAGIRDELRYQMTKALKQWKRDVEHDIINGNTASAASVRCSRGIAQWLGGFSSITASATGSNTANNIQEDDLNAMLQRIWVSGGEPDYILCTPTQKRHISSNFSGSANSRRTHPISDNTLVNVVDFYDSDFGDVKILPHRWFTTVTANPGIDVMRTTFALQADKWVIGFLRPPRNIPLAKTGSSEKAMVEGEWTLVCLHPSANAYVKLHASATAFTDDFPLN